MDCSYFLELKKYHDKMLVFDYQIEYITYTIFDKEIKTNKWVDFKVWLKIHEKLEQLFKHSTSSGDLLDNFINAEVILSNFGVNIKIVKTDLGAQLANIVQLNTDNLYPFVLQIHINHIKDQLPESKPEVFPVIQENPKQKQIKNQTDKNKNKRKNDDNDLDKNSNEYNPLNPRTQINCGDSNQNSDSADIVPYKATKMNDSQKVPALDDSTLEKDPYSPKPIELIFSENEKTKSVATSPDLFTEKISDEVPKYKASPILIKSDDTCSSQSISPPESDFAKIPKSKYSQLKKQKTWDSEFAERGSERIRETRSKRRLEMDYTLNQQSNNSNNNNGNNNKQFKSNIVCDSKVPAKKDLFGSDDSDIELESDCLNKSLPKCDKDFVKPTKFQNIFKKSTKSVTKESLPASSAKKTKNKLKSSGQGDLDGWLAAKDIPSSKSSKKKGFKKIKDSDSSEDHEKDNTKESISKILKSNTPHPIISNEERRLNREKHEMDMYALSLFNDQIKKKLQAPTNLEFKSLNHMSPEMLVKTFDSHKTLLDRRFDEFNAQKCYVVKAIKGVDHMALRSVVNDSLQYEMLQCLKDHYESSKDSLCYTDLFMNLMLPEWILGIFIDEYRLSRSKAIQQLKDQEDVRLCSQMDNSQLNFSQITNL